MHPLPNTPHSSRTQLVGFVTSCLQRLPALLLHKAHGRAQAEGGIEGAVAALLMMVAFFNYPRIIALSQSQLILLGVLVLCGIVGLAFIWRLAALKRARERLLRSDAYDLSPTDFERRVVLLLRDLGWEDVERSGGSGDGGVDVRATREGKRYVIQCKRYKRYVQPERVREMLGVKQHTGADVAMLVTTASFGSSSHAFARQHGIVLWDGATLGEQMRVAQERNTNPAALRAATQRRALFLSTLVLISGVATLAVWMV
ncbi:MAG TPA: restriction endonuclease [Roseiflexaceae bacterium]|nr:restriction endonuclease [Roseiflexaceae bacterium]